MENRKWQNASSNSARSGEVHERAGCGKNVAAVTVGVLVITSLAAVGCSKSKEPSRVSDNRSSQMSSVAPLPLSTPTQPGAAVPTEKPKKAAKKRSSTVTYKDVASGVSFQYPRKYTLKTGDNARVEWSGFGPVPMNFIEPGGVPVAAVELPKNSYPGTDFASAFFNVSVNRSLSMEDCGKFGLTDAVHPDEPGASTKVTVGGKEFEQVEDFGGAALQQADAKYYHLYENGACYEFALGLGTAGYGVEEAIEPVDRSQVFSKLEKILATVKLQPVAEKEVVISKAEDASNKDAVAGQPVEGGQEMEKTAASTAKEVPSSTAEPTKDVASGTITQPGDSMPK